MGAVDEQDIASDERGPELHRHRLHRRLSRRAVVVVVVVVAAAVAAATAAVAVAAAIVVAVVVAVRRETGTSVASEPERGDSTGNSG